MGVTKLTSMVEGKCGITLPTKKRRDIVVDGNGLKYHLFVNISSIYDSCPFYIYNSVRAYFKALKARKLNVVCVYFDCHTLEEKRSELLSRATSKYKDSTKVWKKAKESNNFPTFRNPSACSDHLFIEAIYRYAMETNSHITIRYSCNDCDKEIAKYAYEHSYLILGKDSDYFIYKNPGYIPFPSKGDLYNKKKPIIYYTNQSVAKGLNIPEHSLSLVATLFGNDFYSFPFIFYEVERMFFFTKDKQCLASREEILEAIHKAKGDIEKTLAILCPTADANTLAKKVKSKCDLYDYKDLNPDPFIYFKSKCTTPEQLMMYNTIVKNPTTRSMLYTFFKGYYSATFVSLVIDGSVSMHLPRSFEDDPHDHDFSDYFIALLTRAFETFKDSYSDFYILHPIDKSLTIHVNEKNNPMALMYHVINNYLVDTSLQYYCAIQNCLPDYKTFTFDREMIYSFILSHTEEFEVINPCSIFALFILKVFLDMPQCYFEAFLLAILTCHKTHNSLKIKNSEYCTDICRYGEYYKYLISRIQLVAGLFMDTKIYFENKEADHGICFFYVNEILSNQNNVLQTSYFDEFVIMDSSVQSFIEDCIQCVYEEE